MSAATPQAASYEGYRTLDRRIALAFGLLLSALMLIVLLAGGWYLRRLMERDHNRLSTILTSVLADVVSHGSFSGKYQARLLLEEIKRRQPDLVYLRVLDAQARVLAHSDPQENDAQLGDELRAWIAPLLDGSASQRMLELRQGGGGWVREVSMAYRGGFGHTVQGVIQVGISDTARATALRSGIFYIGAIVLLLTAAGVFATARLSRYFGRPVRSLAIQTAHERQRLENVLEAMHAGTWEWDLRTREVQLDARWAEIVGYRLDELAPIGEQTFVRLCHPDDLAASRQAMEACLAGRTPAYASECRMRHRQGHWVWVLDSGSIVERDADGRPLRLMGARQDVTVRKQAEEAYRQESGRFVALARASNTGVWEWDQTNGRLWCSEEYFGMLGRQSADFGRDPWSCLEQTWLDLLHPDDREPASQKFAQYLAAGSVGMYDNEFRMRHAEGRWIWIWSRGSGLRDDAGRLTGRTVGTHINVSSLKEAEARLLESREQLRLLSNNIPDVMVFQLDCGHSGSEDRALTYVSAGVERMHGVTAAQAMADATLLYRQVLPADRERMQLIERECIARMSDFNVEVRAEVPGDGMRWFAINSSPTRLADGRVRFDGIEIDITERKRREQQVHELNASLELRVDERTRELRTALDRLQRAQDELLRNEKLVSLGALVAGVAHELNTPVGNAVTVASTLVQRQRQFKDLTQSGLTRSALADYLQDMEEGGQIVERNLARAAELIGSFKQLAVDQTSYQRRRFDLREVVDEILLAMRPTIRKAGVRLHDTVPPALQLDSFPGPLGQVLINLINNAIVHAFEGREGGEIALHAQASAAGLCIEVRDDGRGIPPEHQKKLFDPFFTTRMGQGGSGLGLHIVYSLVNGLLGGRIEVHSSAGAGSRFELHLPLSAPAQPMA